MFGAHSRGDGRSPGGLSGRWAPGVAGRRGHRQMPQLVAALRRHPKLSHRPAILKTTPLLHGNRDYHRQRFQTGNTSRILPIRAEASPAPASTPGAGGDPGERDAGVATLACRSSDLGSIAALSWVAQRVAAAGRNRFRLSGKQVRTPRPGRAELTGRPGRRRVRTTIVARRSRSLKLGDSLIPGRWVRAGPHRAGSVRALPDGAGPASGVDG